MSNSGNHEVDRRKFLAMSAAGVGALALNGTPLSLGRARAQAVRSSAYPNYYPANVAPPDIPGNAAGAEPGYTKFPRQLVKSVSETPASGGTIRGMTFWVNAIPTPMDRNTAWQQLNTNLGANLDVTLVPQADYAAKWGTVTASGDLPDLLYISIVPVLPNIAAFVNASCADLTEHLGGDAVKDYPNLAALPSSSWNAGIINGKLWGIPISRPVTGWPMYVQTSLLEKLGMAGAYPKNAEDFKAFCKALTNPSQGRWALGVTNDTTTGPYSMSWFQGVFNAPNNWRLGSGGGLVKDIETEEYKAALVYLRELVAAGYVSPDVKANPDLTNDLFASKIVMRANAWNAYAQLYVNQAKRIGQTYRTIPPFGHDGGPGTNLLGPGHFGWVTLKKGSPERVKEMLRVINYLASPFGSEEFMITRFGIEGQQYTFNEDGAPIFTPQGMADFPGYPNNQVGYLGIPAPWLYSQDVPEYAEFASAEERGLIEAGVTDPTQGHYSPTDSRSGAQLQRLIFDRVSGIAAGRQPISDLDKLVSDWKAQGGDRIREEYEKSIAG